MKASPEAGTGKFSKHYSAKILGGRVLVLMCYLCREAVLPLRFSKVNPKSLQPTCLSMLGQDSSGCMAVCPGRMNDCGSWTFSCSVLWSRMSEKELGVPASST